jgi:hypothetical protein
MSDYDFAPMPGVDELRQMFRVRSRDNKIGRSGTGGEGLRSLSLRLLLGHAVERAQA